MPYRTPARVAAVDPDEKLMLRDYVMARGAAAIASLESARNDVVEAMNLFITPADDKRGKERRECLDSAIESASIATRALEDAMDKIGDADLDAGEPWEEEDDDPDGAD